MSALTIETAPAAEPISTADAKTHLRVSAATDDDYIDTLVVAARQYAETCRQEALITQTWKFYPNDWPAGGFIEIPMPPLVSVTHVKYTDSDGTENTWSSSNYIVDTDTKPGRVVLADGISWPTDSLYPSNPIEIQFVAGYGAAADVPQHIIQGMKLLVSHLYENREPYVVGQTVNEVPLAVESLLGMNRVYTFPK